MVYSVSDTPTDIEQYTSPDCENMVIIAWDGESREITTYTRGTRESLYRGPSMEAARLSLDFTNEQWDELLRQDVEYLVAHLPPPPHPARREPPGQQGERP